MYIYLGDTAVADAIINRILSKKIAILMISQREA